MTEEKPRPEYCTKKNLDCYKCEFYKCRDAASRVNTGRFSMTYSRRKKPYDCYLRSMWEAGGGSPMGRWLDRLVLRGNSV